MKATLILKTITACLMLGVVCNCAGLKDAALKINTPAVQMQIIGDVEKDVLAGGGALLISGGNSGAAVAAMTSQEVQNIPGLKAALAAGTPAVVAGAAVAAPVTGKQPVAVTP